MLHQEEIVAARAESLKGEKYMYSDLLHSHKFTPFAVKSSGVLGPWSLLFSEEVGEEIKAPDKRREGGRSPHLTHVHCCAAGQYAISILWGV